MKERTAKLVAGVANEVLNATDGVENLQTSEWDADRVMAVTRENARMMYGNKTRAWILRSSILLDDDLISTDNMLIILRSPGFPMLFKTLLSDFQISWRLLLPSAGLRKLARKLHQD